VEDVVAGIADIFGGAYAGKRVFVTGHTGFKGSWLTLWLTMLGATVRGYALDPDTDPALWNMLGLSAEDGAQDVRGDIRDLDGLCASMAEFEPEIVFHLAAQPLVLASYDDPVGTYATNIMGTVHVLEAVRSVPSVRAVVVVTSDKCYENREQSGYAYVETDPMGGYDPYSSSKGAAELVTAAYRRSFFSASGTANIATARAGNVIGGGDWAPDRIVPDCIRAVKAGEGVVVRNPGAIRPWQHVLDPLHGYFALAVALLGEDGERYADAFNFGPAPESAVPVAEVVDRLLAGWPGTHRVSPEQTEAPHEAHFLMLDWSRAERMLGWSPAWGFEESVDRTSAWWRASLAGEGARALCSTDVAAFCSGLEGDR
jgi:CDP-glucose 4,6-dehydratase